MSVGTILILAGFFIIILVNIVSMKKNKRY